MTSWLLAIAVAVLAASVHYGWRAPAATGGRLAPAVLRGLAVLLLAALALDAPAGRARHAPPFVALDASASWQRAAGDAGWQEAERLAARAGGDSVFLFGDSLRAREGDAPPGDARSGVRAAVERALAAGRRLVVVTDGELDDADALRSLPAGSRVEVIVPARGPDLAVESIDLPRSAVAGDTVEARVTVAAGARGAPAGTLRLAAGPRVLGSAPVDAMAAFATRTIALRLRPEGDGPVVVRAAVAAPGDAEARNDTLSAVIELSRSAAAVLVSTAPDYDARFALAVLRGAVQLPTRAYFRVAPGQWRADPSLAPVAEAEVRRAAAGAPLLVLHGDSTVFGPPRALSRGGLLLFAPPPSRREAEPADAEWFATAAPASPVASVLAGTQWDSLPPIDVAPALPELEWEALETRRARRLERRVAVVGTERPRRTVIVGAAGLWRWHFRGGAAADAYAALWGGIFDWLAAERADRRAAVPAAASLREGEPVRWRRGASEDSIVRVALVRRGAPAREDSLVLRFAAGASVAESPPLPAGEYEVRSGGGTSVLVVDRSREWLPRRPAVQAGAVGGAPAAGDAPRLRDSGLAYLAAALLLCLEWLLRRRAGLR